MTEQTTTQRKQAAYGAWLSPISAADVAAGSLKLSQPLYGADGKTLYWLEGRPQEGGRQVLVRRGADGLVDVNPAPFSVRTLVHEYGGGSYTVGFDKGKDRIFAVGMADQQIYEISGCGEKACFQAVTEAKGMRFADLVFDPRQGGLIAVVEDHTGVDLTDAPGLEGLACEPINYLASIAVSSRSESIEAQPLPKSPAQAGQLAEPMMLTCGYDFFSTPRFSQDGKKLAYMAWKHPNMPWDESVLFIAEVGADGSITNHRKVLGGPDVSVFQPQWGADGTLYFVGDQSGYWQLYAIKDFYELEPVPVLGPEARAEGVELDLLRGSECGLPMWVFGQSTYAVLKDCLVVAYNHHGIWRLVRIEPAFEGEDMLGYVSKSRVQSIDAPYTEFAYLTGGDKRVCMLAGSAQIPNSVVEYDIEQAVFQTIKSGAAGLPPSGYLSSPEVIEFPTEAGKTAFAFYYPPANLDFEAPADSLPPLIVKCHGGPTGCASSLFSLSVQYWTSRGFAYVDVNYGGSTGFGREYRKRLNQNWGVVDVQDACNAVKYLTGAGKADPQAVAISGGSAGGFTVLAALTFTDVFKAGASHYGIGDLEALLRDTHKFESRYLDNLVGAYPFSKAVYQSRSPINHIDKLACPVIFFQGLEDKVVPPNQAEAMVKALKAKGIPTVYIAYKGEQHGFRKAENIISTLESELGFFLKVFKIKHQHKIAELPAFA